MFSTQFLLLLCKPFILSLLLWPTVAVASHPHFSLPLSTRICWFRPKSRAFDAAVRGQASPSDRSRSLKVLKTKTRNGIPVGYGSHSSLPNNLEAGYAPGNLEDGGGQCFLPTPNPTILLFYMPALPFWIDGGGPYLKEPVLWIWDDLSYFQFAEHLISWTGLWLLPPLRITKAMLAGGSSLRSPARATNTHWLSGDLCFLIRQRRLAIRFPCASPFPSIETRKKTPDCKTKPLIYANNWKASRMAHPRLRRLRESCSERSASL